MGSGAAVTGKPWALRDRAACDQGVSLQDNAQNPSDDFSISAVEPSTAERGQLRSSLDPIQRFLGTSWPPAWADTSLDARWRPPLHYVCVRGANRGLAAAFPYAFQAFGPVRVAALAGPYYPWRGLAA